MCADSLLNRLSGAVALLALGVACGGPDPDCEAWAGAWRGTFEGEVEGSEFALGEFDFEVTMAERFSDGDFGVQESSGGVEASDTTLLLNDGWVVQVVTWPDFQCADGAVDLTDDEVICFVSNDAYDFGEYTDSDVCDFTGTLSGGSGSGEWNAPAHDDRSPTATGTGQWTLALEGP